MYRIPFDSLENILCQKIAVSKSKNIGVVIEKKCQVERNFNTELPHHIFGFHICKLDSKKYDIAKRSNRVINICGKIYPVYFQNLDDVFCKSKTEINIPTENIIQNQLDNEVVVDLYMQKVISSY